ncbi:bifunctional oligoribonuclease/PAP phosphatase NrnA [Candidatus Peregrinibacteria bacterium]|jgi:bifunctional oligoribonuclease and PAP phosphatase NrnA|nr:bifunctional oligoribonuclease/PAP phosphatase NrnA [Candidatus Peregrinibacteria bacterium]
MNHRIQLDIDELKKARDLIAQSSRVLIISHRNPDADSIGANSSVRIALESMDKTVSSACADPVPENLQFMKYGDQFLQDLTWQRIQEYDLIITVDCGAHYLVKYHETIPQILSKEIPIINIDHHASNDLFGNANILDREGASTTLVLYFFFKFLGVEVNTDMATSMLAGLYFDTGSFKHSNTSSEVLAVTSHLMHKGADYKLIVNHLFKTTSINRLKLWGRALSRARLNDKDVLVSNITEEDLKELELEPNDLSGVIDYLNSTPDSKFCILLTEDMKGNIKGSCRTLRDDVDLSKIAGVFGGGGHRKAAGFTIPGHLEEEVVKKIKIK